MNQRLQGWQLALALLIPALIIGAAGFIAYGALSNDDQDLATGEDDQELVDTPTVTPLPESDAEPTTVADPTAIAVPTPLVVPGTPAQTVTAVPVSTATPGPTSPPSPQPTSPSGPAPTATPTPGAVTIACAGTIPAAIEVGDTFGPLTASTTPAAAATSFRFTWNLGNTTTVTSPATGTISYAAAGSYTISLAATNPSSGATASVTCGTVTVTEAVAALEVTCAVTPVGATALNDARAGDTMRVTTTWTPDDIPLYLQYEFETTDDLVIVNPASSGNSQTNAFSTDQGRFSIFWRYQETSETGRLSCAAYPGAGSDPAPTATPTATVPTPTVVAPTPTSTVTPEPTATVATPEPTATVATPEPTVE